MSFFIAKAASACDEGFPPAHFRKRTRESPLHRAEETCASCPSPPESRKRVRHLQIAPILL